jgi:hypothetical protein
VASASLQKRGVSVDLIESMQSSDTVALSLQCGCQQAACQRDEQCQACDACARGDEAPAQHTAQGAGGAGGARGDAGQPLPRLLEGPATHTYKMALMFDAP